MPTTYSPAIPNFPTPGREYDRENENQFRRRLEQALLDIVTYNESLNADPLSVATHVLATTGGIGPQHSVSGLTAGFVLRAFSATDARFQQLAHADLGGITADQHHAQSHVLATETALGPDHIVSGLTAGWALVATGATTALFRALTAADVTAGTFPVGDFLFQGNVSPATDNTRDLGVVTTNRWRTMYAGTSVITPIVGGVSTGTLALQWNSITLVQLESAGIFFPSTTRKIVMAATSSGSGGALAARIEAVGFNGGSCIFTGANTFTDLTNKSVFYGIVPYTIAERNGILLQGQALNGEITVSIGGGVTSGASVNEIRFVTRNAAHPDYSGGTTRWRVLQAGHLTALADNTYDLGGVTNRPRTGYFGTSITVPTAIATTRVTSPLLGTTTATDVVFDRNSVTQLTLGSLLATFAGGVTVSSAQFTASTLTHSPGIGADGFLAKIGGTLTEAGSGTHALLAGLHLTVPTVTGGAAAVTEAATLYIAGAPTASGAGNYAGLVAAGIFRLKGGFGVGPVGDTPSSPMDDYALTDNTGALLIDPSSLAVPDVTGLTGGFDGRVLVLINAAGGLDMFIRHEDASSAAANRIRTPDGVDMTLIHEVTGTAGEAAMLIYDATVSRWRAFRLGV
jgi:hypothetical protein